MQGSLHQVDNIFLPNELPDERDGTIPLTTVIDEEVTTSHQSHEIEQKIFDDIQSHREQEDRIIAKHGSFMMIE